VYTKVVYTLYKRSAPRGVFFQFPENPLYNNTSTTKKLSQNTIMASSREKLKMLERKEEEERRKERDKVRSTDRGTSSGRGGGAAGTQGRRNEGEGMDGGDLEVDEAMITESVRTPARIAEDMTVGEADRINKRKERSPLLAEEARNVRKRLNEFDVGELFSKIGDSMKVRAEEALEKSPVEMKESMRCGMEVMIKAVEDIMNGLSDGIKHERIQRETLELRIEDRLEKLEEKVKELDDVTDSLTTVRIKNRTSESVKEMESKVEEAMCTVKLLDLDIGRATEDKREMVRKTLDLVRSSVLEKDLRWYDIVIRRTRVIIMGKATSRRERGGETVFTVPTLFQCKDRRDTEDLEGMLRGAGFFPAFHWPAEMMDFVGGVREEVKKMGYSEREYFFKVRPEKRDGCVQVKVEIKAKQGANRFALKGVWACPPLHKYLWDSVQGLFTSKLRS